MNWPHCPVPGAQEDEMQKSICENCNRVLNHQRGWENQGIPTAKSNFRSGNSSGRIDGKRSHCEKDVETAVWQIMTNEKRLLKQKHTWCPLISYKVGGEDRIPTIRQGKKYIGGVLNREGCYTRTDGMLTPKRRVYRRGQCAGQSK